MAHHAVVGGVPAHRPERSEEAAEDAEIVVTVSDNGSGEETSAARKGGAGIGKKLIDGLLRQLKGRMTIESGNGVTTRIFLPQPRIV